MEKMDRDWTFTVFSKYKDCGHQMKLVGANFKTNSWKLFFTQQALNLWFPLLNNAVDSTTLHGVRGRQEKDLQETSSAISQADRTCPQPIPREVPTARGRGCPGTPQLSCFWLGMGWTMAAGPCHHPPRGAAMLPPPGSHQPWWHRGNRP